MRPLWAATLVLAALPGVAAAQTLPGVKPKPVATTTVGPNGETAKRPATQTPADTAKALAQAERQAIQSDLAWTGHYNGLINGEVSDRLLAAIKAFQKDNGHPQTGVLNPQERGLLAESSRKLQGNVGWKLTTDPVTGAKLGVPTKLVPQQSSDANGSKWASSSGTIQILSSRRKEANATAASLADAEKKTPPDRKVEYAAVKPDFFVLSGTQGLKKFYVRGAFKDAEIRILTILYDQATEGTMEPVVIAMSSSYTPFPAGAPAGPPPKKTVEYSTGSIVSSDGAILADRSAIDGCLSIVAAGFGQADLQDSGDKDGELALLKIYGAQVKPLSLGTASRPAPSAALDLTGIADPQSQGGGASVTRAKAQAIPAGSGGGIALSPSPGLGFSGAPARDADGKFAGIALLRPPQLAGSPATAPQAALIDAASVRRFLDTAGIKPAAEGSAGPRESVVRIICVRK